MRQSRHIGKTSKDEPKDAQTPAHRLLLRAGYLKQVGPGLFSWLPLMCRTLDKLAGLVRVEMAALDIAELRLPGLQPRELYLESGRWDDLTADDGRMFTFKDRRGGMLALEGGQEEAAVDLIRKDVSSYKQLPKGFCQIDRLYLDEVRPRFGLVRPREALVARVYGFSADQTRGQAAGLAVREACRRVADRLELSCLDVVGEPQASGVGPTRDLVVLNEAGETSVLICPSCGYAAAREGADSRLKVFPRDSEIKDHEAVYGPGLIGVEPLAEFLNIPVWKTTKTLLFQSGERTVAVMVRGDCDVSEAKVKASLKSRHLALASAWVVTELTGAEVGYAGPIDLPPDVLVLADHYTKDRINFECGANRTDYHYINVNFGRDFPWPVFGDFKLARPGEACPGCADGVLQEVRGLTCGRSMEWGTELSTRMNCTCLDRDGRPQPMHLVSQELDLTRLAAAVVDRHHDEAGIVWPRSLAPYQVHLIGLNLENDTVRTGADVFYQRLQQVGLEVLYDDREARAGEKFGDADLIGLPIRMTVSKRTCANGQVEFKLRHERESRVLGFDEALTAARELSRE